MKVLPEDPNDITDYVKYCCAKSGGQWDQVGNKCVAPPATGTRTRHFPDIAGDLPVLSQVPQPVRTAN